MMNDLLNKVCEVAVKAGRYQTMQRKTFSRDAVRAKRKHDYVSYVDKESERMIVAALKDLLPGAGFITEEKTTEQDEENREYEWIIDPLDGTTNYIHGLAPWGVCIALRHKGRLVLGVFYEVSHGELFYATEGGGAWLRTRDGEVSPLHVSTAGDIDQALVCIGYPYDAEAFRPFCTRLTANLYGRCTSLRSFGSAGAELCYVAAGRLDAYVESFLNAWDISAGAIIIKEAGGMISDYQGGDGLWPEGREVLATNGLLHGTMIEEIRRCGTRRDVSRD